ncbi:DUF3368 domain-containing protein [Leptospira meyeri]|uniref:DUF3368 domain-containing protein n=1 Tax=Leptospira meyeri TaxID=29508 RepID=UPI000C29B7E1|nr:DUF3368 domain-containing protein [Leptospira meyeri]PKA23708.1 DUF3368 domain-containing protein [Leptospira sp. mixed culture ATI2-C-A1]MCW7487191.1 DUF3368 domain-containing protein [Leptospira meyeri]PKA11087.1 DUF3368 domain-containing protein [Leptospira meyeri]TGM22790.1 DUF3368 domain-containing protein [Leptospira meyeri]TGM59484.1 DUF3368 domain-containing protein [Leptospira meyeri]
MPDVISNTSCLILLSKIQQFGILKSLYNSVIITDTVKTEFGKNVPDFIKTKNPTQEFSVKSLEQILDSGEASTNALALESKNSLVILDDLKARKIAKNLGLKITGTLGILAKAKKLGIIEDLEKQINELQKKGIWISESVLNEIRKINNSNN